MLFSDRIKEYAKKMNFTSEELDNYFEIIFPIIMHDEFQRRLTKDFPHHDDITLGEHILMVSLKTYQIALKYNKNPNFGTIDIKTSILIALFHDYYTLPWQNNPNNIAENFYNKHGFVHPVEAVINSTNLYPEYFIDPVISKKIVDGVLHHMYPFPVRSIDGSDMELNNEYLYQKMPIDIKNNMIMSTSKGKMGKYSFALTKYKEGQIVNIADKIVSAGLDLKNFNSLCALVTGHNKNLVYKK